MFIRKIYEVLWKKYKNQIKDIEITNEKMFSLSDEDTNFTGESVVSLKIFKQSYKVSNWKEFYEKSLNMLYNFDPIKFR